MCPIAPDDPSLTLFQVLREDGTADPATDPLLDPKDMLAMHREMVRVRLLDERMLMRQRQGKVGFFGMITGQEATPIATAFATEKKDWIFPALRENSIMLARGFALQKWLAQVYGNEADVLKGRQMPSHMSGREVNQVSWSSCIGPQIPQAVGAAWAAKLKGDDVVTVGFMGDGATSEADFHCGLNFAGVYQTPCVLICQNNHWAISVASSQQTASATFAVKAHAYGIPGIRVDGNDVLALYRVIREAADRARRGDGPTFIEAVTYRIGPHSSSDDPTRYRSEEEVAIWRKRDPIARLEQYLMAQGLLSPEAREQMESEITEEILTAIGKVESLPRPARETLFTDVYEDVPWHLKEQQEELLAHEPAPTH